MEASTGKTWKNYPSTFCFTFGTLKHIAIKLPKRYPFCHWITPLKTNTSHLITKFSQRKPDRLPTINFQGRVVVERKILRFCLLGGWKKLERIFPVMIYHGGIRKKSSNPKFFNERLATSKFETCTSTSTLVTSGNSFRCRGFFFRITTEN